MGQVDVQGSGYRYHVAAEILQRGVDHFKTNGARHLCKILAGDADPFVVILDQPPPAASKTGEVLAKSLGQAAVPPGIHFDVLVEQFTNPALAILQHFTDISWAG
ncbi:hypothetical protein D3C84_781290 [compost metagenome]